MPKHVEVLNTLNNPDLFSLSESQATCKLLDTCKHYLYKPDTCKPLTTTTLLDTGFETEFETGFDIGFETGRVVERSKRKRWE